MTHSRVSPRRDRDRDLFPSFDRNGIALKKRKKGEKKRKNAHVIRTHRGGNDNCTVRTSMDEEHEVDFKVSLSKMLLTFLLKFTSNLISLSHDW